MNTWQISEHKFDADRIPVNETLFHTANGYVGVRGNFEEEIPPHVSSIQGSYINGFYEYYENAGKQTYRNDPDLIQTIFAVTDAQRIELWLDEEKFSLFEGTIINYNRTLDMQKGVVTRSITWQSPQGKRIALSIQRMASFVKRELFLIHFSINSLDFNGKIKLRSHLSNPIPLKEYKSNQDFRAGAAEKIFLATEKVDQEGSIGFIQSKTKRSHLDLLCSISHKVSKGVKEKVILDQTQIYFEYEMPIAIGEILSLEKYVVYTDNKRHANIAEQNMKIMQEALHHSFSYYSDQQEDYLKKFWERADILIKGDDLLQSSIRFNIYQLLQSVGKDHHCGIAAKGLSATGYEGQYFWDTEIYMIPFFVHTFPELAKNLLLYRYYTLPEAREHATQMDHPKGALFAWQTINGKECTTYYPISSTEYHINSDIAYAIFHYYQVTEDLDFLASYGAEILFETARVIFDIGHFRKDGLFCIDSVTGPDEYKMLVNNNYYTNIMAKSHFETCHNVWNILQQKKPQELQILTKKIAINEAEIKNFVDAAHKMHLPFDENLKIYAQDDSFLQKKKWNFESTSKEQSPFMLRYSHLSLNRYQICKQADTVLANMLREEEASMQYIKNSYDYYEKITTFDSSLAHPIFSIMACRIGDLKKAFNYFKMSARMDLDDVHHNVYYGIHTACMGGSWMCITYGFAGLRIINEELHLHPQLPQQWQEVEFSIYFKGRRLLIRLTPNETFITLLEGNSITIYLNDKPLQIDY